VDLLIVGGIITAGAGLGMGYYHVGRKKREQYQKL